MVAHMNRRPDPAASAACRARPGLDPRLPAALAASRERKDRNRGKRRCRACGCTDADCRGCIARIGRPCRWVAADLSSACVGSVLPIAARGRRRGR